MAIVSRVLTVLDFLSKEEKEQIVPWLKIFYDKKKPYLAILCRCLLEKKSPQDAWKAAFPGEAFAKDKYHRRCFILADALDQFLTCRELSKSPDDSNRLLLQAYSAKGSFELLERAQARMYQDLNEKHKTGNHSLSIEKLRLAHDVATARQVLLASKQKLTVLEGIRDLNETFDTWWLHEKLYLTLVTLYNNFSESVPELPFLADKAIEEAKLLIPEDIQDPSKTKLSLRFLYHIIVDILLKPKDLANDREVIPQLFQWITRLGFQHKPLPFSIINFYYFLVGICINRSNRTSDLELRHFFFLQVWEMYMWGIKKKILLQNGKLPWNTFIMMLQTLYRLEVHERGKGKQESIYENKLEELGRLLPQDDRTDAILIGKAMLFFYKKDYSRAQRILSIKFNKPLFEALGRSYLCQAMYEQHLKRKNADFEELRDHANALRRYLDRAPELTESFKERMKNFCLFYDKLCKDYRRDRLPSLGKRIQKTQMIAHREWLIIKVREKLKAKEASKRND